MRRRLVKFRSLVHTYMSHRRYLKVRARPSPFYQEPGLPHLGPGSSRGGQEALSTGGDCWSWTFLGSAPGSATPWLCDRGPPWGCGEGKMRCCTGGMWPELGSRWGPQ